MNYMIRGWIKNLLKIRAVIRRCMICRKFMGFKIGKYSREYGNETTGICLKCKNKMLEKYIKREGTKDERD